MSRWKRILVWLGIAVVACCTVFWFFGVQTLSALEARYIGRKSPVVKRVPIELSDLSVSQTTGKKLSYFGYEFEVPWDDIDESKSRTSGFWYLGLSESRPVRNMAIVCWRTPLPERME